MDDDRAALFPDVGRDAFTQKRTEHEVRIELGDGPAQRVIARGQMPLNVVSGLGELDPHPLTETVESRAQQQDLHDATPMRTGGTKPAAGMKKL
jgi:hypothetical protein